ncbi:hypothetical protein EGW08_015046 [Elysia chlorotica]|uniref:TGF-beta family profile domain-containing protein n=1 Tax=Elysia chlorotica TaxID=188477 RepID=A0A3S0ZKU7_ELYCH|nr:hypothetical protein EGW08_015046 [Elysia chlorotica]
MTNRLTKQLGRATQHYMHQPNPSSLRHLFLFPSSLFLSNSSPAFCPSSSSSSFSFSSLFTTLLLILTLLQSPHIAKGRAVAQTKDNVREEFLPMAPPASFVSSCEEDHGELDPITQQKLVQELKANLLKYHGIEEVVSASPETAALRNGSHPEGRKVRQRLRDLARSKALAAGSTKMEVHIAEGSQPEKYVFHSNERDRTLLIQMSDDNVAGDQPLQVISVHAWFPLPEKIYHDLVIKTAVLRMRMSRPEVRVCRHLASHGLQLTADIYLLPRDRPPTSLDTGSHNISYQEKTFLKSVPLRSDSDNLVTVEIDTSLLPDLIDTDGGQLDLGLRIKAGRASGKANTASDEVNCLKSNRKLEYSKRKLEKAFSMLISPLSLHKVPSSLSAWSVFTGRPLSTSSSSPSTSSFSSSSHTAGVDEISASSKPLESQSAPSTENRGGPASVVLFETSAELGVVTADLRENLEEDYSPRTRRSATRSRRRGRSRSRGRSRDGDSGCRGGGCCLRSVIVPLEGEFIWNKSRRYIFLDRYRVNYCSGRCRPEYNNVSNLGELLGRLHRLRPDRVPAPSCIPDELGPMALYLTDSDGYPTQREFPNMMVQSCQCL